MRHHLLPRRVPIPYPPAPGADRRKGITSILVDGLDLSGKTTLIDALLELLAERGVNSTRHHGLLARRHPLRPVLDRLPVPYHRSGAITAAHLIGGFALDSVLTGLAPSGKGATVLVQDSYVDRTIAAGIAQGPFLGAALALWALPLFPRFDIAVYLHADPDVRRLRLERRDPADVDDGDRSTVADEAFARRFDDEDEADT
ncbi:hypothetical protein [Kitasatospora indigofera]|uniref:hypothetical protein n=1 Tax=Kitasatospora indigofera TaxID=67307 RepID=UPI0033AAFA48